MTLSPDLAAAEAAVRSERRALAAEGISRRPLLAEALRRLARAREAAGLDEAALAAAHEGVAVLSPMFLERPAGFAAPMRALLSEYVALAQRHRRRPDELLLQPIGEALGALIRVEDEEGDREEEGGR